MLSNRLTLELFASDSMFTMGSKLSIAISAFRMEMDEIYEEGPLDPFKSMALRAEIQALEIEHDQVKMNLDRKQMELLELQAHLNERQIGRAHV